MSVSKSSSSTAVTTSSSSSSSGSNLLNQSSSDRVEVIKLPPTITSNGAYNLSSKGKEVHDLTTDHPPASGGGVNLSLKANANTLPPTGAVGSASNPITIDDFDAPLNLSMKPSDKSSTPAASGGGTGSSSSSAALASLASDYQATAGGQGNSLQSLSSITAALGGTGGMPGGSISGSGGTSPSPASAGAGAGASGGSGSGSGGGSSSYKEGRPRNLGRGVSKPKKNTVASLLAQSRAVGLKPMLATQQLLQQGADIVSDLLTLSRNMSFNSNPFFFRKRFAWP